MSARLQTAPPPKTCVQPLTKRETEVAALICEGQSNKEIAWALGISPLTVRIHVHKILVKTGVRDRVAFILAALGKPAQARAVHA